MIRGALHPSRGRLRRALLAAAVLLAAQIPGSVALAADPVELVFSSTGAEQTFEVPAGVQSVHVVLVGGRGGTGYQGSAGGFGARVEGDLAVTPGTTLYVEVAGNGGDASHAVAGPGGFNGGGIGGGAVNSTFRGGGGGGASDLRTVDRNGPATLASRLIVAAGAGGGGGWEGSGQGGDAGANGETGEGGYGGGGGAGTATAGGAGGVNAGAGSLGQGGFGAAESEGNGGGGGAGLYGGGGGGAYFRGAGGGGGSSFTGDASNASVTLDATGVPSVTITYTPDGGPGPTSQPSTQPGTGVVDADVTVPSSAACIEVSTTSITFGTQRFGGQDIAGDPVASIHLRNCSGSDATLLARGTNASGGQATWHLVDDGGTCAAGSLAIDAYHLKLLRPVTGDVTSLSIEAKSMQSLAGGGVATFDPLLDMPCPGSSGAGETMGMQIVFVVTE